jgi:hypothetical protein
MLGENFVDKPVVIAASLFLGLTLSSVPAHSSYECVALFKDSQLSSAEKNSNRVSSSDMSDLPSLQSEIILLRKRVSDSRLKEFRTRSAMKYLSGDLGPQLVTDSDLIKRTENDDQTIFWKSPKELAGGYINRVNNAEVDANIEAMASFSAKKYGDRDAHWLYTLTVFEDFRKEIRRGNRIFDTFEYWDKFSSHFKQFAELHDPKYSADAANIAVYTLEFMRRRVRDYSQASLTVLRSFYVDVEGAEQVLDPTTRKSALETQFKRQADLLKGEHVNLKIAYPLLVRLETDIEYLMENVARFGEQEAQKWIEIRRQDALNVLELAGDLKTDEGKVVFKDYLKKRSKDPVLAAEIRNRIGAPQVWRRIWPFGA